MDQQQVLQQSITSLSHPSPKPFRNLHQVIKSLNQYTSDPQHLPSPRFIPCVLFTVPTRLYQLLGHDPNELLEDKPERMGWRILVGAYLKGLGRLVLEVEDQIKHIVVEGMGRSIMLIGGYTKIAKKWIKILFQLWGKYNENLEIPLRCHLTIAKYLQKCDKNMFMWSLRRMYVTFFQNCKQVSWRNYQHINFMINSFCEVLKLNPQRSYYVLFGYLRSIALQLDKFHKSKRKQKTQLTTKLYSNQILNCFKLYTAIVTRVQCEQFTAFVYPLCEIFAVYDRVTEAGQYLPLKLHLLEFQLTIIDVLGIYVPHTLEMIQKLINSSAFNRKISKKSQKIEANIQLAYKLSPSQLKQAMLINQLFKSLLTKIYKFESLMCRPVHGPEIVMRLYKIMKSHKFVFSQYQQQFQKAAGLFKSDYKTLYEMRAKERLRLGDGKGIGKFEGGLKGVGFSGAQQYYKLKQQQQDMLKKKLQAQRQQNQQYSEQQPQDQPQNEDQLNSGWQQASQGASQMDPNEIEPQDGDQQDHAGDDEEMENVSYEGDPEDADQAVKQWSEEEWSSQEDIGERRGGR